jgi:hypothetical protein
METVGIFRGLFMKGLEDSAANVREAAIGNVGPFRFQTTLFLIIFPRFLTFGSSARRGLMYWRLSIPGLGSWRIRQYPEGV